MVQNPLWIVSNDNMYVNQLYYEMKGGKHAVILVSREFANYRIFETKEQAMLCLEKLEHLREERDPLWAKMLLMLYS